MSKIVPLIVFRLGVNVSNVDLHLFEKSAQVLGVAPTASWEQVQDALCRIENPSPIQKMAADVLMHAPVVTRKLVLGAWHKKNKPDILETLRNIHIPASSPITPADGWKKEHLQRRKAAFYLAKEKQAVTLFCVSDILGLYPMRSHSQSKRVWLVIGDPLFMDMLKFLGLIDHEGFEGDEKVISIEIEPHLSSGSVKYEARYKTSGKRGGQNEKTVNNGATGWRRKPVLFSFPASWTDFVLAGILSRYKDKDLLNYRLDGVDKLDVDLICANMGALQKEKEIYPETCREIERIIYLLADKTAAKKMKAADRMRQWRADHPDNKSSSNKEERNAYMKDYRKKNKEAIQKKQREYTQKWRSKQNSPVA